MSWFTDLAGKAEAFLERVDQATATTIQNVNTPSRDVPGSQQDDVDTHIGELHKINTPTKDDVRMEYTKSHSTSDLPSMVQTQPKSPKDLARVGNVTPVKYFTPGASKQRPAPPTNTTAALDNDSWLEYLNSPSNNQTANEPIAAVKESNVKDEGVDKTINKLDDDDVNKEMPEITVTGTDDITINDVEDHVSSEDHVRSCDNTEEQLLREKLSNMELENNLLRDEVKLLNTELANANKRVKEMHESTARDKHEVMLTKEQLMEKERLLQQLRGKEEDTMATINSKTSQLLAIKRLLEETQAALEQERNKNKQAVVEKERLVKDCSETSGLQAQAMDSLQEKMKTLQSTIDQEKTAFVQAKNEFDHRERRLTQQLQSTTDTLHNTEMQLKQLQGKHTNLLNTLKSCQAELQTARQEHLDYKQRATSILQNKEKVIADLREGHRDTSKDDEAIIEQIKMEKSMVEQQLSKAEHQLEKLRAELMDLETSSTAQLDHVTSQLKDTEEALNKEKYAHNETRAVLSHTKEELLHSNEEMIQYKMTSSSQLKDKEQELQTLQEKIVALTKSPAHTEQAELETRLQELTESLIEKQTTVETLSSERNSLQLQLNRAKRELSEMEQSHRNIISHHNAISITGLDGASAGKPIVLLASCRTIRVPQLHPISVVIPDNPMTSSSMKSSLSHRVKQAANTLDTASIRVGVFLRRYPYARLFLLGYGVLLHLWVMIVLLTYSPEIHPL